MNETEQKKSGWLSIIGLIALIVVLFAGIKLIFFGLGEAIPQQPADSSQPPAQSQPVEEGSTQQDAPAFCPFCGEELNQSFQWGQYCPFCGEKVEP